MDFNASGDDYLGGVTLYDDQTDSFLDLNFLSETELSLSVTEIASVNGTVFASGQFLTAGSGDVDVWGITEFNGVIPAPTSINELGVNSQLAIEIFPNPSSDFVSIKLESKGKITILNSLGAIVYEENAKNSTTIDVSNWDFGCLLYSTCF